MESSSNTTVVDRGQAQPFYAATTRPSAQPTARPTAFCTMRPWIEYELDGKRLGFFFDLRDHDY
jgi:hypothetical protein